MEVEPRIVCPLCAITGTEDGTPAEYRDYITHHLIPFIAITLQSLKKLGIAEPGNIDGRTSCFRTTTSITTPKPGDGVIVPLPSWQDTTRRSSFDTPPLRGGSENQHQIEVSDVNIEDIESYGIVAVKGHSRVDEEVRMVLRKGITVEVRENQEVPLTMENLPAKYDVLEVLSHATLDDGRETNAVWQVMRYRRVSSCSQRKRRADNVFRPAASSPSSYVDPDHEPEEISVLSVLRHRESTEINLLSPPKAQRLMNKTSLPLPWPKVGKKRQPPTSFDLSGHKSKEPLNAAPAYEIARGRKHREQQESDVCPVCVKWHAGLSQHWRNADLSRAHHLKDCCKHKFATLPPPTPRGYWDVAFPPTQAPKGGGAARNPEAISFSPAESIQESE